jgi:hypothetical protein
MRHFTEDRRKLKELILYVSQQCASKRGFGSVTLYKILYFSDHFAYGRLGHPITGAEYIKEKHGPIPRTVLPARRELEREARLGLRETPLKRRKGTFKQPVAIGAPDMSVFTPDEIAVVDGVIRRLWTLSTRKVRTLAHESAVFHSRAIGETIPYETIFVHRDQRLTDAEIRFGQQLAKRHGWTRSGR